MANSDSAQILKQLPIVVGMLGGALLVANRVATPTLLNSQSRSDALGIILSALLILTGLLWQRVQPKAPEAVELVGQQQFELADDLSEAAKAELAWASKLLLTNTVTQSVVVWWHDSWPSETNEAPEAISGQQLMRRGILPSEGMRQAGAIVERVLKTGKPVYLVDLKLFPGRVEFDYLPENTQGVICQPLSYQPANSNLPENNGETRGVLILGANAPRSYTQQDENWIQGLAEKLSVTLGNPLASSPVAEAGDSATSTL